MPYKNINKRTEHSHIWYINHKQEHLKNMKDYYNKNKQHILRKHKIEYDKFKANRDLRRNHS